MSRTARQILEENGLNQEGTATDQSYVQQLLEKYNPMLEGIQHPYTKSVMSVLYENQSKHLRKMNEETYTTGVASFTKYLFPILRRVFPNLIANQVVSVQPMTSAVGGVFTYEYKYGDTKGSTTANQNLIQSFNKTYTSEMIDYEIKVASTDVDGVKAVWNDGTNAVERLPFKWLPIRPYNDIGTVVYRVELMWTSGSALRVATDDGAGNLMIGATNHGTVDYATGAWTFTAAGLVPDIATPIYAKYFFNTEMVDIHYQSPSIVPTLYGGTDQVKKIPDLNIDISMTTIQAITRKLKASWSSEAMDDLKDFYGLDAETELVAGISNEIALELDREILGDLHAGAAHSATYAYGPAFGGANVLSELQSIRQLVTVIDAVSARIHKTSLRAPANFIVLSPAIGSLLSQLTSHADFMMVNRMEDPVVNPTYGVMQSNFGIQKLGTLMNKYTVFQDPFMDDTQILIGLKGATFLDAGYVFAPYVPLQVTPTFLNPADQKFSKGLRTRYATKMLRNEYYGKITVSGLPTVNTLP